MSKNSYVFTSESVSEGHPDKVCDQISDAILDACLRQDPDSRVACETLTTTDLIVLAGEITSTATVDYEKVARETAMRIGYDHEGLGFSGQTAQVIVRIHAQSPDIAQGVSAMTSLGREQGAGDQGLMFGYACNDTPALMPAPIYYAHLIMKRLADLRHSDRQTYRYLRPDAKSQVSLRYEHGKPVAVNNIVVSHQHTPDMDIAWLRALVKKVVAEIIPAPLLAELTDADYYVNPTGRFEIGGPNGDSGLTGRKIIVDSYGGMGRHGGGAFSGKDPSKVDRSATYMARYAAKNIVAAGLADRCEIQVAYAIGVAKPLSININTFGTGKVAESDLTVMLTEGKLFDFRPAQIIDALKLKKCNGWNYTDAAAYGHFGRDLFPWEKTDKVAALQARFIR